LDGNLHFCGNQLKSIRRRRENDVDTLKLHHETLLKTIKKTLIRFQDFYDVQWRSQHKSLGDQNI